MSTSADESEFKVAENLNYQKQKQAEEDLKEKMKEVIDPSLLEHDKKSPLDDNEAKTKNSEKNNRKGQGRGQGQGQDSLLINQNIVKPVKGNSPKKNSIDDDDEIKEGDVDMNVELGEGDQYDKSPVYLEDTNAEAWIRFCNLLGRALANPSLTLVAASMSLSTGAVVVGVGVVSSVSVIPLAIYEAWRAGEGKHAAGEATKKIYRKVFDETVKALNAATNPSNEAFMHSMQNAVNLFMGNKIKQDDPNSKKVNEKKNVDEYVEKEDDPDSLPPPDRTSKVSKYGSGFKVEPVVVDDAKIPQRENSNSSKKRESSNSQMMSQEYSSPMLPAMGLDLSNNEQSIAESLSESKETEESVGFQAMEESDGLEIKASENYGADDNEHELSHSDSDSHSHSHSSDHSNSANKPKSKPKPKPKSKQPK